MEEQRLLREVNRAAEEDDAEAVEAAAARLLALSPGDADARELRGTALLRLNRLDEAAEALDGLEAPSARFALSYTAYKQLLRHEACLALLEGLKAELGLGPDAGPQEEGSLGAGVLHLEAQARYRAGEFDACADVYARHFAGDDGDEELAANRVAAAVGAGRAAEARALADACPSPSFEVEYNAACALVAAGELDAARGRLEAAERLCREQLGDEDAEELASELAVMQAQRGYVEQLLGNAAAAAALYAEALRGAPDAANVLVTANNNVVSLRGRDEKVFDSLKRSDRCLRVPPAKMSAEQLSGVRLNRCLLMLNSNNKGAECRALAERLAADQPDRAGPVLVLAQQLMRDGRADECRRALRDFCARKTAAPADADRCRLALAHVELAQGGGGAAAAAAAARELRAVQGLRHSPAWVATVVALLERAGAPREEAAAVLDEAVAHHKGAGGAGPALGLLLEKSAEMRVAQGRGADAVALFDALVRERSDDPLVVASAVVASARVDPGSSVRFARHLPPVPGAEAVDAEELERGAAPRARGDRGGAGKRGVAADNDDEEAMEARRALRGPRKRKKRVRYPKGFDPENPGPPPDPERWLPRWARKKGRKGRRRRGDQMRGPQGSMPTADAAPASPPRAAPTPEKRAPPPGIKGKKKRAGRR